MSSSASSLSSSSSSGVSSDDVTVTRSGSVVKFLCSYGGKILPRYPDGKLRYVGGDTRVLAVDRSISFSDLLKKMAEICGWGIPVSLRCQHPTEDLDALVSITSDEDLSNLLEEYDEAGRAQHKIKAFLSPPGTRSRPSTPPSSLKGKSPLSPSSSPTRPVPSSYQRVPARHLFVPAIHGASPAYRYHDHQQHPHLIHLGRQWQ